MATVRTAEPSTLLILDKKSFRELDRKTLHLIADTARYNTACTRDPGKRTAADLMVLQSRTSSLSQRFQHAAHLELCKVMVYRKMGEGEMIVRRGATAGKLYVLISGIVQSYNTDPAHLDTVTDEEGGISTAAFSLLTPSAILRAGDVIGEAELLEHAADAIYHATSIAKGPVSHPSPSLISHKSSHAPVRPLLSSHPPLLPHSHAPLLPHSHAPLACASSSPLHRARPSSRSLK
jgi:CRP-like cAMP-binding protein